MARLLIITGLVITLVGLVIAWPLVRAAVGFRPVRGEILDVITTPNGNGLVRVAIAYEYPLPTAGERAIGYTLTNERLEPVADPEVDVAEAESLRRNLPGRAVRVYYDVNHPLDSAFMLSPVSANPGLRAEHGALMVLIGVASGLYIGANLGPGPRDGLMTAIARRGVSIRTTRWIIEIVVLITGILLGGTFGVGTIAFALFIGPIVQFFLPRLSVDPGRPEDAWDHPAR